MTRSLTRGRALRPPPTLAGLTRPASASAAISARLAPSAGAGSGRALGEAPRWLAVAVGLVISSALLIALVALLMPEPATPRVQLPAVTPQTFRRRILLHVHEWPLSWRLGPPLLLALALGGLLGARRLRDRDDVPFSGAASTLATAVIAIAAWPAAVTVPDSSGQPVRDGTTSVSVKHFDNGDREITTTVEKRHRHLPIQIALGWILLGGTGSALLGRDLAAANRRRAQARLRRPTASSGPLLPS